MNWRVINQHEVKKSISEENLWWLFFSKFIQKRPKCHNPTYTQGRGLWIWALGSGRLTLQQSSLSWLASFRWSRKFYISATSSFPSKCTCYGKHGDQKTPINCTLRCSRTVMCHIYTIVLNRERTLIYTIRLKQWYNICQSNQAGICPLC